MLKLLALAVACTAVLSACGHKFNCVAYETYTCLDLAFSGKDPALYIKALYTGPTFSVLRDKSCRSEANDAGDDRFHFSSTYCDGNGTPQTGSDGLTVCTLQGRQVLFDPATKTAKASDLDGANAGEATCSAVKNGKRSL